MGNRTQFDTGVLTFHMTEDSLSCIDFPGQSLDEVSRHLPNGTYTTLRTFGKHRFLRLDAHLDRLEDSAHLLGKTIRLDRGRLGQALADVLARADFMESRLRITVPLDTGNPPDVYIAIEPFRGIDPGLYKTGVCTVTMLIARTSPRAKTTGFIVPSRTLKAGLPSDIYEVLMVTASGEILEGFTSNFFAVIGSRLLTAGEGVLEGITRSIVLELARELFTVELRAPLLTEIRQFDEAFITSSSRAILPVVAINEQVIGRGKPGSLTQLLRQRYSMYVMQEAKPPSY